MDWFGSVGSENNDKTLLERGWVCILSSDDITNKAALLPLK